MNSSSIAAALRSGLGVDRAVSVLFNFDSPLTDREVDSLTHFAQQQHEALQAGTHLPETPASIEPLLSKPSVALPATFVLQCALVSCKLPVLSNRVVRTLVKVVVPHVARKCAKSSDSAQHISPNDWTSLLKAATSQVLQSGSSGHSERTVKCAVAFLEAAVEAIAPASGVAASINSAFLDLLVSVITAQANLHATRAATCAKDTTKNDWTTSVRGNATYFTSDKFTYLARFIARSQCAKALVTAPPGENVSVFTLLVCQLLASHIASSSSELTSEAAELFKVRRETIARFVSSTSNSPRISLILSPRGASDRLSVDDPAGSIRFILETIARTTTSLNAAWDLLAILSAIPAADIANYVLSNLDALPTQLVDLFVNNHAALSFTVAPKVAECLARTLSRAIATSTTLIDALAKNVTAAMQTRCRSGSEKASLLILISKLITVAPATSFTRSVIADVVRGSLDSPAQEVSDAAWTLARAANALEELKPTLVQIVKVANNGSNDVLRRRLLTHAQASLFGVVAPVVNELVGECDTVETFRPDAFLALLFYASSPSTTPAQLTKVAKIVNQPTVLAALDAPGDLSACAAVAIALASRGLFDTLALLLTHKSGHVRRTLREFVQSVSSDPSTLSSLWDSLTRTVFGIDAATRPAILSTNAEEALTTVASALLKFPSRIPLDSVLTEVLLCCGHDYIQGDDDVYFVALDHSNGRYRDSSIRVVDRVLLKISKPHNHQINLHASGIAAALAKRLTSGSAHVARAAGRALALLLTRSSPLVTCNAFKILLASITEAAEKLRGLNAQDAAILSGSSETVAAHISRVLTDKGLLKVYTPKPPKGMTEEDYDDLKRKEAIALQKGRQALEEEIRKRREALAPQLISLSSPFLSLRLLGFAGAYKPEGLPIIFPMLLNILSESSAPAALRTLVLDTVVGLLSKTPFGLIAAQLVVTTARISADSTSGLSAADVSQLNTFALFLRQRLTHMLAAPLFTVFIPFVRVAFRCSRSRNAKFISAASQHQLLSIFVAGVGQPGLPHAGEAALLLFDIVTAFPPLYKTVLSAVSTLAPHLPLESMGPFYTAVMCGTDLVKEAGMIGFSKTGHFVESRKALLVAATMANDASHSVVTIAKGILSHNNFELDLNDWPELLDLLKEFSKHGPSRLRIAALIKKLLEKGTAATQPAWVAKIIAVGGLAAVKTLEVVASVLIPASVAAALSFLCDVADQPSSSDELMQAVLNTGKVLLSGCTSETLAAVTTSVQQRLKKPPTGAAPEHKERYNSIVVVWLTIVAVRMNDTAFLEATIDQQALVLNTSTSATVHEFVCECMADIARNEKIRQSDRLTTFSDKCINITLTSGAYAKKKAHALGLAGVVSGLGLKSLSKFAVLKHITAAAKDKQAPRSGAFILIEVLADVLGYSFEPYALTLIPQLLEGVAEKDTKISDCADDAAKAVMRNLSDVGLRQLIPRLVEGLTSEQTKKRTPSLNFIGYVAFCSPKQLAATLPFIMSKICECLFDANGSVASAAYNALKKVAGVVSNSEIQEHVDVILNAMRNPSTDTDSALDALMYTRFVHAIDPASLALIIPVVSRGLSDQMLGSSKGKSAQIVASMVSLVTDTKSLVPYANDLVKRLQGAAQDPLNEVRSTSAKAIASLCATIGSDLLDSVVEWVFAMLRRNSSSAEKAGSAQVLVEVMTSCGDRILAQNFAAIEEGMNDESPTVRDSFMHIMVYAPATLPINTFQDFLPAAFPWVLKGLSDLNEKVRSTALVAGSTIIALYGSKNLALVLHPLLEGVMSEVSNLRQSSMLLAAKLLIHLVTIIKKKMRVDNEDAAEAAAEAAAANGGADDSPSASEEFEDTSMLQGGEVKVETARDAEKRGISILGSLEEQIGSEHFIRIVAAMHVGRAEHNLAVRSEVTTAWQICVASPRAALAKVFSGIITMLTKFASSPNPECVDVAESCIEYTCARMGEMLEKFITAFADEYKVGTKRHKIGSLVCLASVIPFGDPARIMKIGGQIVGCVLPSVQDEDEDVQRCGGILFERVTKIVGSRLIESVVESQIDSSVRGVIEVVKVRPAAALAVIFRILGQRTTYTFNDLDLIESIMEIDDVIDEQDVVKYLDKITDTVIKCIMQGVDGAENTMTMLAEYLPEQSSHIPLEMIQKVQRLPAGRIAAAKATGAYVLGVDTDLTENIEAALRMLIGLFGDNDADVRKTAVEYFVEILSSMDKRVIDAMPEEDKADLIAAKRTAGRYTLQFLDVIQSTLSVTARAFITTDEPEFVALSLPKLFETLLNFYSRALDYGTAPQKIQAVECIQDLLSLAPHSIGSTAVSTVSGKLAKVLYVRNEGAVVAALVRLCIQLMKIPAGGKEKMMDSTLATAMFTAILCDLNQARALVLHVVINIVRRSAMLGEIILGTVVSKKANIDNATFRGVMCRFASVVMRFAKIEKKSPHVTALLALVRPMWDQPETTANAVAAGSALGSLCISSSIADDEVVSIAETAIARANTRSVQSVGSVATIYSLCLSAQHRLTPAIITDMLDSIQRAAAFSSTDKLATTWVLRAAIALMNTPTGAAHIKVEAFHLLLKRVDNNSEEQLSSTAANFVATVQAKVPRAAAALEAFGPYEQSTCWGWISQFDADLDDEAASESTF